MKKIFMFALLFVFIPLPAFSLEKSGNCLFEIKNHKINYILDNVEMVGKLAEIYVGERYGKDAAKREKPYIIIDEGDFWHVSGSIDPNMTGGVFLMEIDKMNGRIILFTHGK